MGSRRLESINVGVARGAWEPGDRRLLVAEGIVSYRLLVRLRGKECTRLIDRHYFIFN